MADIFISYTRADREAAGLLAHALEAEGWTVWWDKVIPAGKVFHKVIQQELDAARCVIVIWTAASVNSDWVFAEAEDANTRGALLPVRLEETTRPPLPFRQVQGVTMEGWQGDASHSMFRQLVEAVTGMIGAATPPKGKTKRRKRRPASQAEPPADTSVPATDVGREETPRRVSKRLGLVFSPREVEDSSPLGDGRDGPSYVYTEQIILAVNAALATGRPLLIRGPSGSGKSSLARSIAENLRWRYYVIALTPRTKPRDLLWTVGPSRPAESESGDTRPDFIPGPIWWAFNRESASRRDMGDAAGHRGFLARDPSPRDAENAVLHLDDLDYADPDLPQSLMVVLGSRQFMIEELGMIVRASNGLLTIITSNDEKQLPGNFISRCVKLTLPSPTVEQLIQIGQAHYGKIPEGLLRQVAEALSERASSGESRGRGSVNVRVFLDMVRACLNLKVKPGDAAWDALISM
jgi:MoxR-like ATPase